LTALDTNVLVRFLVRDDERQAQAAYRLFKRAEAAGETLFVPLVVLLETIWVLESAYDRPRGEILDAVEALRRMPVVEFEKDDAVGGWLSDGRAGKADLSDLLVARAALACGCPSGVTFDRGAARLPFFALLR